jgi:hypothetical protein
MPLLSRSCARLYVQQIRGYVAIISMPTSQTLAQKMYDRPSALEKFKSLNMKSAAPTTSGGTPADSVASFESSSLERRNGFRRSSIRLPVRPNGVSAKREYLGSKARDKKLGMANVYPANAQNKSGIRGTPDAAFCVWGERAANLSAKTDLGLARLIQQSLRMP